MRPIIEAAQRAEDARAAAVEPLRAVLESLTAEASRWDLGIPDAFAKSQREFEARLPEFVQMMDWSARQAAEYDKKRQLAVAGDNEALVYLINSSGIEALQDEEIRHRIYFLDPAKPADRQFLERVMAGLRKHVIGSGKRGRRPQTPVGALKLVPVLQRAFETTGTRLKRSYRNPAARDLDIKAISEHVALSAPADWRAQIRRAVRDVLLSKPRVSKGFGFEVVAKALSRSSGWIRSTRKRKQL
jgi:hypothetical protein